VPQRTAQHVRTGLRRIADRSGGDGEERPRVRDCDRLYSPSSTSAGSITIGGQTFAIEAGASVTDTGGMLVAIGNSACPDAAANASGQIGNATINANPSTTTTVKVCGAAGTFTAATASAAGSVTVNGQTLAIAPGTVLSGSGLLTRRRFMRGPASSDC
jgi:hypothetical protein